jgi:N-acyl-D-amino-acid deacylase
MLKDRTLVNARDDDGSTPLMHAALNGDPNTVKLLLERGANPNLANYEGATALLWAVDDLNKVKLLLAAGADVNAKAKHGATALLAACLRFGSGPVVTELLNHHADANVIDDNGSTPLIRAASSGDTGDIIQLLAHGADLGHPAPLTPLAASVWFGNLDAVKLLLSRGAPVDAKAFGFTPLSLAGLWDRKEIAAELLDHGAAVNLPIADKLFMRRTPGTPLMLAAYSEAQDIDLIRFLIARGADVHFATDAGESASTRASAKGDTPVLKALLEAGAGRPPSQPPSVSHKSLDPLPDLQTAVERSLVVLQRSDAGFFNRTGCKSCHNQSLAAMAVGLAQARGFRFDREDAARRTAVVVEAMKSQREKMLEMMEDEGPPLSGSYALAGLASAGYAPDSTTSAFVRNIAARQLPAGNWHPSGARPPIEYSDFSTTALAIHAIRLYGAGPRSREYAATVRKARDWLLVTSPRYNDERVFQMLGLHWSGFKSPVMRDLAAALLKEQKADGGWSQLTMLPSDAYATGQALYSLNQAGGLSAEDPAYQRGVKFLRETQMQDGSWLIPSHAIPIQPPLDAGFPHGSDQFISAAGTGWAAMALMLTHPEVR